MAEFTNNAIQLVQPNQPVILNSNWNFPFFFFNSSIFHQGESGIVTLRGIVNNPYKNLAVYQVTFNGNIAIPTGGTVGPIAVALARNGEPILTSRAIVTPAAVDDYFNVTSTAFIIVPRGCCFDISVENVSEPAAVGGVAPAINVQNANLVIERVA